MPAVEAQGQGMRTEDLEQALASPEGWSRCYGPLDAEGGRCKLRASGRPSPKEACKALPRAGCEALTRQFSRRASWIPGDPWRPRGHHRHRSRRTDGFKVAIDVPAPDEVDGLLRHRDPWQ